MRMRVIKNIQYGGSPDNQLDLYLPQDTGFATIVYFHGGGLESGDKADKNYEEIAQAFVENGYGFASVNYRMYSAGAKFPQFLEDGALSISWIKARSKEYGGNGELYVSGQSAGAWMSMMLCLDERYLQGVCVSPLEIKGWVIDSAQMTAHFNVLKYETGCDPNLQRINEYAPLYYLDGNTRFNRMLILFYENDMPCRAEQNMLFIKAAQTLCPANDLQYKMLKGVHCQGSVSRDESGQYAFVAETLSWLKDGAYRKIK